MITVEYSSMPGLKNSIPQPILPLRFINGKREVSTYALVDSGAAGAVISTVIAEDLGIDWQKIPGVGEISEKVKIDLKNASQHIRRMAIAGLVVKRNENKNVRHKLSDIGKSTLRFLKSIE